MPPGGIPYDVVWGSIMSVPEHAEWDSTRVPGGGSYFSPPLPSPHWGPQTPMSRHRGREKASPWWLARPAAFRYLHGVRHEPVDLVPLRCFRWTGDAFNAGRLIWLALVPLVLFTRRRDLMGDLANRALTNLAAGIVATLIIALNLFLLYQTFLG